VSARAPRSSAALLAALLLTVSTAPAFAEEGPAARKPVTAEDRAAVRAVIEAQIDAFRHDDAEKAFSYAAPAIQELFAPPERFLQMVRDVYAPVYRPKSVKFVDLEIVAGEYTQKVLLVGPDDVPVMALFLMDKRAEGDWKILGCVLHPVEGNTT
jgi:hypothetical protein